MRKTVQQIVETVEVYCDVCGAMNVQRTKYACRCCGRDLCRDHVEFDDRDGGDYPDHYCQHCWAVGEPYRRNVEESGVARWAEIEANEKAWHEQARATVSRP